MIAGGANLRGLLAHDDVSAVAALPHLDLALGEDLRRLYIVQQGTVSLQTKQGNQRKELHPGEKPEICFALCEGDEVEAVYAYCNLHSLWKA